ncbi:MAG: PQQ-dependent sugar dehydrogenase, partial [Bacteroidota bacterium]
MKFLSEDEALLNEKDGDLLRINLTTGSRSTIAGIPQDLADSLRIDTTLYPPINAFPGAHGTNQKYNAGLFDLALDPDFATNRWLYISYAAQESERGYALRVVRGQLNGNQLENLETLLTVPPFTSVLFHFGGGLTFGADGKLYVTAGERLLFDSEQPPLTVAQNLSDPRGKIYRLNPDGSIPDDNPDFGDDAIPGLYAYG